MTSNNGAPSEPGSTTPEAHPHLPSVHVAAQTALACRLAEQYGRKPTMNALRKAIADARTEKRPLTQDEAAEAAACHLAAASASKLKTVYNLTGTILHTNLGRALLAEEAVEAANRAMRNPVALEYDLSGGRRGERDDIIRGLLCALTGAEDATLVNNNAAAVLLTLNTLAAGRSVIVSRGELIEIGGAFRMPDIMASAGVRLTEVGTTNRTHLRDYEGAIGPETGALLKVHTSNYRIEGFTKAVPARELSALAKKNNIPLVDDLGSGTLVGLSPFGLPDEPTVSEALQAGADLVTFSGDKLLGGPQAGFVVGRRDLIEKINKNPMKRAMRADKIRLAAIEATLRLYQDPDRLTERLPTYRALARSLDDIRACADRLLPAVAAKLGEDFSVSIADCESQVGSGAAPTATLPSLGLAVRPVGAQSAGKALGGLAAAFRSLPAPVVGRVKDQALIFDLRCLEDEAGFVDNLSSLDIEEGAGGAARK
nr:L-seryl-tRNA(Sec) selenium transferase [Marinicaulis flavus]